MDNSACHAWLTSQRMPTTEQHLKPDAVVDCHPVQISVAVADELGEVKVEFEIVICWVAPAVPHATS